MMRCTEMEQFISGVNFQLVKVKYKIVIVAEIDHSRWTGFSRTSKLRQTM